MEISQALEALSFLSGEEKEVGRTRVGVGLSERFSFGAAVAAETAETGPWSCACWFMTL